MEPKDLLPILFERSNAMATLWNMDIVVVLGMIAFLASAWEKMDPRSKGALTAGFLVMALFNMEGLIKVTEQRRSLVDSFRALKSPILAADSGYIDPLYVLPVGGLVVVHLLVDGLVVWFIWRGLPRKP